MQIRYNDYDSRMLVLSLMSIFQQWIGPYRPFLSPTLERIPNYTFPSRARLYSDIRLVRFPLKCVEADITTTHCRKAKGIETVFWKHSFVLASLFKFL